MATFNSNPFQPPEARVDDVRANQGQGRLIAGGQQVRAGSCVSWIGRGWAMFKEAPGVWVGITAIFIIIAIISMIIPFINLIISFLGPVFMGGIMLACKTQDEGNSPTVGHLFSGFSEHFGPLVVVSLLYLGGALLIGAAIGIFAAIGVVNAESPGSLALVGLLALIPIFALAMSMFFAPVLVVLHGMKATEAMQASFHGCLKNIGPLILYFLLIGLLSIVAAIPIFLGFLVLVPVLYCSMYTAYKDIFIES